MKTEPCFNVFTDNLELKVKPSKSIQFCDILMAQFHPVLVFICIHRENTMLPLFPPSPGGPW